MLAKERPSAVLSRRVSPIPRPLPEYLEITATSANSQCGTAGHATSDGCVACPDKCEAGSYLDSDKCGTATYETSNGCIACPDKCEAGYYFDKTKCGTEGNIASNGCIPCPTSSCGENTFFDATQCGTAGYEESDGCVATVDDVACRVLTAGDSHTCALLPSGDIRCWGENANGEASNHTGAFSVVDAGVHMTCAVNPAGKLTCWGDQADSAPSSDERTWKDVSCGTSYCCALDLEGRVECFGSDSLGCVSGLQQLEEYQGKFTAVSAGYGFSCAIVTGGFIKCWGNQNNHNVIGLTPQSGGWKAMRARDGHGCAISNDGLTLSCWGDDWSGRVSGVPSLDEGELWEFVDVGSVHSVGITNKGRLLYWGYWDWVVPNVSPHKWVAAATGSFFLCGTTDDAKVHCWGWYKSGASVAPTDVNFATSCPVY